MELKYPDLKYYKIHPDSQDLCFATKSSVCFDIASYLKTKDGGEGFIDGYNQYNDKIKIPIISDIGGEGFIIIKSGERVLIPSGIIFDIPEGFSVRTKPRSGTGYKIGLTHPHNEGIIDEDYFHETFLLLQNITQIDIKISHSQRLVQAEMVKKHAYNLVSTDIKPVQKTDRVGGFGSTGK